MRAFTTYLLGFLAIYGSSCVFSHAQGIPGSDAGDRNNSEYAGPVGVFDSLEPRASDSGYCASVDSATFNAYLPCIYITDTYSIIGYRSNAVLVPTNKSNWKLGKGWMIQSYGSDYPTDTTNCVTYEEYGDTYDLGALFIPCIEYMGTKYAAYLMRYDDVDPYYFKLGSTFLYGSELAVPHGVSASNGTYADKIRVSWKAVPGASEYMVGVLEAPGVKSHPLYKTTNTYYDYYDAGPGEVLYFKVYPYDAEGNSGFGSILVSGYMAASTNSTWSGSTYWTYTGQSSLTITFYSDGTWSAQENGQTNCQSATSSGTYSDNGTRVTGSGEQSSGTWSMPDVSFDFEYMEASETPLGSLLGDEIVLYGEWNGCIETNFRLYEQ